MCARLDDDVRATGAPRATNPSHAEMNTAFVFVKPHANTPAVLDVIKAKFKLEDIVQEALCEEVSSRRQCADVNAKALELALDVAAPEAKERYLTKGRQLVFGDDYVSPWGPGWEFDFGLSYTTINASMTEIVSTSLISEPDFIISSAAGMHYCDLLSPY